VTEAEQLVNEVEIVVDALAAATGGNNVPDQTRKTPPPAVPIRVDHRTARSPLTGKSLLAYFPP
jgi:hypothetical protein